MNTAAIYFTILTLAMIGTVSIVALSVSHFLNGSTCPMISGFPACYVLTIFILGALISHLGIFNDQNILFFIGAGFTLLVAIIASVSQWYGWVECPKLFRTIPTCYLSFLLFGAINVLKILEIKLAKINIVI